MSLRTLRPSKENGVVEAIRSIALKVFGAAFYKKLQTILNFLKPSSCAATAAEDEPDYMKMELDLNRFRAYTQGYLEAAPSLTDLEVQMMPLGALTMTMEVDEKMFPGVSTYQRNGRYYLQSTGHQDRHDRLCQPWA